VGKGAFVPCPPGRFVVRKLVGTLFAHPTFCREPRGHSWQSRFQALHQETTSALPTSLPPCPLVKKSVLIFLLLIIAPVSVSAANYFLGDARGNWQTADRSSAGLLPNASAHPDALIRVYAARTVRWRGIFAVHTWIVLKERGAPRYSRYDYTAWGDPIRVDGLPRTDDGSALCPNPSSPSTAGKQKNSFQKFVR